jgi:hypothetical protein
LQFKQGVGDKTEIVLVSRKQNGALAKIHLFFWS